ncbi:MAG: bacterial Ig-like domain-containing protein [Firmicutes bacterium]|nr:bacterial Ig-like domain-containing protein [Bacillota bacterium]
MGDCFIVRRGGGMGKIPTGIEVTTPPTKTSYKAGEKINLAGMVVKANFSDGSSQDITSQCAFSPSAGTTVYEDTTKINVTWIWDKINITYQTSQAITVTRVLSSIAITTQPTKRNYTKGETLNLSGMVVKATFNSGNSAVVTSYTTSPANGSTLSTIGTITVTVSYAENGVTKNASTTVTVSAKIVTWAAGTDAEIADMVAAADAGQISLKDYWAAGQERTVSLAAMAATGVGETHAAQNATLVLMDSACTGFTLATTTSGGKAKPDFIVGLKNSLLEKGYINSDKTNANGWSGCARRTWCNNIFRPSIPASIRGIFKQFKWKQGKGGENSSGILETTDYFGLAPEKAIFGSATYSQTDEAALYAQWDWYKTSANQIKKLGDTGSANSWWGGSPCSDGSHDFCYIDRYGSTGYNYASNTYGLAPFGCI